MLTAFDVMRLLIFASFGIGIGFMVLTNMIAFMVLRPPKKLGFLWWHITSISLSFLCIGIVATERVAGDLGEPITWRTPLVLFGMLLYMVAQAIIFSVERQRLVLSRANAVVTKAACPPVSHVGE